MNFLTQTGPIFQSLKWIFLPKTKKFLSSLLPPPCGSHTSFKHLNDKFYAGNCPRSLKQGNSPVNRQSAASLPPRLTLPHQGKKKKQHKPVSK